MGRMKGLSAAGIALAALMIVPVLVTCDNSIDLKDGLTVEVMKSNDRYLRVVGIDIPLNAENKFSPSGTITVYFDREIDPSTLDYESIVIRKEDGTRIEYPEKGIEYIASSRSVRIRVYPYLPINTDYLVLVAGVRGKDDSALHDIATASFTTQEILAGSIDSIEGADGASLDGYTLTEFVNIEIQVDNLFAWFSYDVCLDAEPDESTIWHEHEEFINRTTLTDGKYTISGFDLSALNGFEKGLLPLTIRFRGSNTGTGDGELGLTDSMDVFLDTGAPVAGTLGINAGATWTTSAGVRLTFTVAPEDPEDGGAASGVGMASFSNDGATWSDYSAVGEAAAWNLVTGSGGSETRGARTVYAKVRDLAGNISEAVSQTIGFDDVAPSAGTWAIDGGAAVTNSAEVNLSATTMPGDADSGVTQMRFSNDGNSWSEWETINATKAWNLVTGEGGSALEGTKTLYAQARDAAGNISASATDTIEYDGTPPDVSIPDLAPGDDTGISDTDNVTNLETGLTFTGTADSGGSASLYDGETLLGTVTIVEGTWTLDVNLAEGDHSLAAVVVDGFGNQSESGTLSVTVDTTAPGVPTITGTTPAANRTPTWSWTTGGGGIGAYQYWSTQYGSDWFDITATSFTAPNELSDGNYTLYVREKDAAGNLGAYSYRTIYVNLLPNAPSVTGTASPTLDPTPTWNWEAQGFGNGTFRYQLDSTSGSWTTVSDKTWTSASLSDGNHTLYVAESDAGGEWSLNGYKTIRVTQLIPYHKQTAVPRKPTLSWRSSLFATSYTIMVSLNGTIWTEGETVTGTSYTMTDYLSASTKYYWKIRNNAKSGATYTPSTGSYYFTTGTR